LLLDKGAPVNARGPNGLTPLMMAARYGSETIVDCCWPAAPTARRATNRRVGRRPCTRGRARLLVEKLQPAAGR
jgi:hypothetical protein